MAINQKVVLIILKIMGTGFLLFIIFAWVFFLIAILPMILFVIMHGKKNKITGFKFAVSMIPVLIVWSLIWRMWRPDTLVNSKMIKRLNHA